MSESAEDWVLKFYGSCEYLNSQEFVDCEMPVMPDTPEFVEAIKARDAAIRKEALENIRDVVLDKLIDLFNEMREELEEPNEDS